MAAHQNFITDDTSIKGNITTASSLTIAGAIEGNVNAGGEVLVLPDAVVHGDVSGPAIRIEGKVEGRITTTGRLVISGAGVVLGDISVLSLLIEEGGTLQGQCSMGRAPDAAASRASRPASGPSGSPKPAAPKVGETPTA